MIRLKLHDYLNKSQLRRPIYRAVCKDGKVRLGYLCFIAKRHLFRPATEIVMLREKQGGKLYKFRPETLAIWTQVWDRTHKPICLGDRVIREDSYTRLSFEGEIAYSLDIAGFVWCSKDSKYKRVEPMYTEITVTDNTHEFEVSYTYTVIERKR